MLEIAQMTQQIVKRAKEYDSDTIPGDYATLDTPCPQCGGQVKENYRRFACTACEFSISKIPGGRQFEIEEVEELLRKREIGPLQGFRSKMGRPFAAILKIAKDDEGHLKMEFDFGQNDDEGDGEPVDFSGQEPVGTCPKCSGAVFEHGMKYVCENSVASPRPATSLRARSSCSKKFSREQVGKLLNDGRTDLLTGFKSSRTGRNFKAFLVRQPDGKIGFEFEVREPKAGAKAPATAHRARPTPRLMWPKLRQRRPRPKTATKTASKTAATKTAAKKAPAKTVAAKKTRAAGKATVEAEE